MDSTSGTRRKNRKNVAIVKVIKAYLKNKRLSFRRSPSSIIMANNLMRDNWSRELRIREQATGNREYSSNK
ncbi:MAG: hypothetical protein AB4426_18580 [Xenococcaceae cyanobacterium]